MLDSAKGVGTAVVSTIRLPHPNLGKHMNVTCPDRQNERRLIPLMLLSILFCLQSSVSRAGLNIQFDYSHDSNGFFDDVDRREALETAAKIVNRYVDDMAAIEPSGENSLGLIIDPSVRVGSIFLRQTVIPEDTITILVGGQPMQTSLARVGLLNGSAVGSDEFKEHVRSRGQSGVVESPASDFSPAVSSMSFNSDPDVVNWHFGLSAETLADDQYDFITVAMSQLTHAMGFGTADSFNSNVNTDGQFVGPSAIEAGSPDNPTLQLNSLKSNWERGTTSEWNEMSQTTLMDRFYSRGDGRRFLTELDRAALRDIGWEEAIPGDANRDRAFDSSDLVSMFTAAKYETGLTAGWSDGDFNDDAVFDSGDLVVALQTGLYEKSAVGQRALHVPETCNSLWLAMGLLSFGIRRRLRHKCVGLSNFNRPK